MGGRFIYFGWKSTPCEDILTRYDESLQRYEPEPTTCWLMRGAGAVSPQPLTVTVALPPPLTLRVTDWRFVPFTVGMYRTATIWRWRLPSE